MRELLLGDWRTKAWAFGLALLLWYYASQQVTLSETLYIPLRVIPRGKVHVVVKRPEGQVVEVRIRGRRTLVERLRGEELRVEVPVEPPATEWERSEVELTARFVEGLSPDVEVLGFSPEKVRLELSRIGTKSLPVLLPPLEELGKPAPGYRVASIAAYPEEVEVEGPVRVLEQAPGIPIKPIHITPVQTGLVERWDWPLVGQLDGEPVTPLSGVAVLILIVPETRRARLEVPVLLALPPDYPYQARLAAGSKTVEVEVEAPAAQMGELKPEAVLVVAPVKGLTPSETQQPVTAQVILPQGVSLVGDPPVVTVDVRERPLSPAAGGP